MNEPGVFYTPDSNNAWIGSFAQGVSQFPVVGGIVASFISPSLTANYVKNIEGDVYDTRSGWTVEQQLLITIVVLAIFYAILKRK